MIKTTNIVEYKRKGDKEWRFVCAARDYDTALARFADAKTRIPDAAEIRIRVKVSSTLIAEEWRKKGEQHG